jgi:predicted N-acyltransferase
LKRGFGVAEFRILTSIGEIPAARWNACVPESVEEHACLTAIERANIPGFTMLYILIEEKGELLAVASAFTTAYNLETMMDGQGARIVARLRRSFPRLLAPRLACLGSPCTETAAIGFHPKLHAGERSDCALLLLLGLSEIAAQQDCALLGIKDLDAAGEVALSEVLDLHGYVGAAGQAVAWLPIDFQDVDEYLGRLSRATRRGLRRKLRNSADVRVERRSSISDVTEQIFALYRATLNRAAQRFEELTPLYFTSLLEEMQGRATCTLYFVQDELIAANFLIEDKGILLDKYWCMADAGRDHDLYYLSWINNIRYALERGLSRYQAGQANVGLKRSLGCRFDETVTHVRHRNPLCNRALRLAVPWLAGGQSLQEAA